MKQGSAIILASALYLRDKTKPIEDLEDNIYAVVDVIGFSTDEHKADLYAQLAERLSEKTSFHEAVSIIEAAMYNTQKRFGPCVTYTH
jgi:hypothetical protein